VILDTGVLIALERDTVTADDVIGDDQDAVIAAITAAEFLEGIERADPWRAPARRQFFEKLLLAMPVEDYTLETARIHATLLAHLRQQGKPRGAHDLIIAATAAATGRILVTRDHKANFEGLPGVICRYV
jgi:tRNA(fMet)-specific endonuclease VapC